MLSRQLRDNWRDTAKQSLTLRVGLFWSFVVGMWAFWPAVQDIIPLWLFFAGCVAFPVALFLARVTKQPGADA